MRCRAAVTGSGELGDWSVGAPALGAELDQDREVRAQGHHADHGPVERAHVEIQFHRAGGVAGGGACRPRKSRPALALISPWAGHGSTPGPPSNVEAPQENVVSYCLTTIMAGTRAAGREAEAAKRSPAGPGWCDLFQIPGKGKLSDT